MISTPPAVHALGLAVALGLAACTAGTGLSPVQPAPPSAPASPLGGLPLDAVIAFAEMDDGSEDLLVTMFWAGKASSAQLAAAPAGQCAARRQKLVSQEVKALEHPEELPGARKLVVRCR